MLQRRLLLLLPLLQQGRQLPQLRQRWPVQGLRARLRPQGACGRAGAGGRLGGLRRVRPRWEAAGHPPPAWHQPADSLIPLSPMPPQGNKCILCDAPGMTISKGRCKCPGKAAPGQLHVRAAAAGLPAPARTASPPSSPHIFPALTSLLPAPQLARPSTATTPPACPTPLMTTERCGARTEPARAAMRGRGRPTGRWQPHSLASAARATH